MSPAEKLRTKGKLAAHTEALEVCPTLGELQVTAAGGKYRRGQRERDHVCGAACGECKGTRGVGSAGAVGRQVMCCRRRLWWAIADMQA